MVYRIRRNPKAKHLEIPKEAHKTFFIIKPTEALISQIYFG